MQPSPSDVHIDGMLGDPKSPGSGMVPYRIKKSGDKHCVVNSDTGKEVKCHPTREHAVAHLQALYSNVKSSELIDLLADFDDGQKVAMAEAEGGVTAAATADPPSAFLAKMKEFFKGKVSADDFDEAVRKARAHAGGIGRARKIVMRKTEESIKNYDYLDPVDVGGPFVSDHDEPDGGEVEQPGLEKADSRVSYRAASVVGEQCGSCRFYTAERNDCGIVEGFIDPKMVCDLFAPAVVLASERDVADLCALNEAGDAAHGWRLFNELPTFQAAEPPAKVPYFPAPGKYKSERYGPIELSPERIKRFVDNFNAGVYQTAKGQPMIPLDAEHETKLSGAVAWITGMSINGDGSVDANVDWTDRGRAMVEADRFKFISPEWYDSWTDPATGRKFQDIAIGGALTTRPFFKEKAGLRSLVATEHGLAVSEEGLHESKEDPMLNKPPGAVETPPNPNPTPPAPEPTPKPDENITASESKQMAERVRALEADLAASKKATEERDAALKQAAERITAMEKSDRHKRFAEVVLGHDEGGNNLRWFGETEKNVSILETIADAVGEDSEQFKEFCTSQRANAELMNSKAFKEVGKSNAVQATEPESIIEAKAKAMMEADPKLTEPEALEKAMSESDNIYRQTQLVNGRA